MPVDNKRLPVPEDSFPPSMFMKKPEKEVIEIDAVRMERPNGRRPDAARAIYADIGVNNEARGSAYLELGNTKIICAVHGPREVLRREEFSLQGQLLCELKFAPFSGQLRRSHLPGNEEKEMSRILQSALESAVMMDKFPKTRFDIFVMVLEDEGSALAAAITCSSLALVNAGVPMFDLVIGASLLVVGDNILFDPVSHEESAKWKSNSDQSNKALVTLGYLPSLNQVSACDQRGLLDSSKLQHAISCGIDICKGFHPVLESRIKSLVKKQLAEQNGFS